MTTPLRLKHNPSHMPEDELIRSFVVRQDDLDAVLEVVTENRRSDSNQHLLILAPRGMGKTTLVNRVIAEIRRNPGRTGAWLPVAFDEESYTVTSAGELWALALTHMAEQTGDRKLREAAVRIQSIQDTRMLGEVALARMLEYAAAAGKRILLVLENIDMLFEQQMSDDEGWKVRHTLQNEPTIMVLATATTRLDAFHDSKRPLYELFREYTLERLDLEECRTIWRMVTGQDLPPHQARPIQIFTGGNTRLLIILASFARERSFRELMDDLVGLIDENTPYFKHNVEALPSEERKVFVTLADLWSPSTTRQVAERSRGEINKVSALLGRLVQRGAVEVVRNIGTVKLYQVVERMYNLYHLLRRRGETRVRGVVEFMVRYYDAEAMRDLLDGIASEACSLPEPSRIDHVRAFLGVLRRLPDSGERHGILRSVNREFLGLPGVEEELRHILSSVPTGERDEDDLLAALARAPEDFDSRIELAALLKRRGALDEALDRLDEAFGIEPTSRRLASELAGIIVMIEPEGKAILGRLERMLDAFIARASGDTEPLLQAARAWLFVKANRRSEAQEIISRIIENLPNDSDVVSLVGSAYLLLGDHEAASAAFEHALDVEPSEKLALQMLTILSLAADSVVRAEALLRDFVRFYPRDIDGWLRLVAFLEVERGDSQTVDSALGAALAINPDSVALRVRLADRLFAAKRHAEAEKHYRYVVSQVKSSNAQTQLLHCLISLKRLDEAFRLLDIYLEDGESADLLCFVAMRARMENRRDDCLRAVERARALDPSHIGSFTVGFLDAMDDGKLDRARELLESFVRGRGENPSTIAVLDDIVEWSGAHDFDEYVLERAIEAAKSAPDSIDLQLSLARAYSRVGEWSSVRVTLKLVLDAPVKAQPYFDRIVALSIDAAAHGHGAAIAQIIALSASATKFEPLIVACRRAGGEVVDSPQEVREVSDDILRRIEAQRHAKIGDERTGAPTELGGAQVEGSSRGKATSRHLSARKRRGQR